MLASYDKRYRWDDCIRKPHAALVIGYNASAYRTLAESKPVDALRPTIRPDMRQSAAGQRSPTIRADPLDRALGKAPDETARETGSAPMRNRRISGTAGGLARGRQQKRRAAGELADQQTGAEQRHTWAEAAAGQQADWRKAIGRNGRPPANQRGGEPARWKRQADWLGAVNRNGGPPANQQAATRRRNGKAKRRRRRGGIQLGRGAYRKRGCIGGTKRPPGVLARHGATSTRCRRSRAGQPPGRVLP